MLACVDREVPGMQRGFTLYELLVTMTIAAILLSLGAPSFSILLARSQQTAEINALFHAFHRARKESIRRRQVVSLCPSRDGRTCHPGKDWSQGWIMFNNADQDSPPRVDPGEFVVLRHRPDSAFRITANRRAFTLRSTYRRATNGTLVVCHAGARVPPKALVVSYTGRPRTALTRPDGTPFTCAD